MAQAPEVNAAAVPGVVFWQAWHCTSTPCAVCAHVAATNAVRCAAAALEFKDTLADLEDEVAELTQQVQHLERFTVDAISFEVCASCFH